VTERRLGDSGTSPSASILRYEDIRIIVGSVYDNRVGDLPRLATMSGKHIAFTQSCEAKPRVIKDKDTVWNHTRRKPIRDSTKRTYLQLPP
jgi:hypothetical protein